MQTKALAKSGRTARRKAYARARVCALVRGRDEVCQVGSLLVEVNLKEVPAGCEGKLDVHERIPRSAWPAGDLVVENCLLVCRRHHEWIDAHPGEDEAPHLLGFHGYSWERPREGDAR